MRDKPLPPLWGKVGIGGAAARSLTTMLGDTRRGGARSLVRHDCPAVSLRRFDQRYRLAVDDADLERERIDALDAAKIDAVAVLAVLAVGDIGEDAAGLAEIV